MKYIGMPLGMWLLFEKSFREQLVFVLGYDKDTARSVSKKAKLKYKEMEMSILYHIFSLRGVRFYYTTFTSSLFTITYYFPKIGT